MDDLVWAGDHLVCGNSLSDCDYAVWRVDGADGSFLPLRQAESPQAFLIVAATDSTMTISTRVDNCAPPELRGAFLPECVKVDLRNLEGNPVACPRGG